MKIINDTTVVVYTSDELKSVIEGNNLYTTVYFGSDITLKSGISIPSSKTNLIIDGTYAGVTYKYVDIKSTGTSDTIRVSSSNTKSVIVRGLDITGYNYYGVIYVPDSSTYKDVSISYENINYIGTQIGFNPYGLTRFIDSNITIQDSYSVGNEVCECNRVEIGGKTTIIHNSTSNSAFWFRNSNPYLKILEGADVSFTSTRRELIYGVNNLSFSILNGAKFSVTSYNGMAYGTFGTSTTLISKKASFSLKQTNYSGSYATWYSYGSITLEEDSSLDIINNYSNITTSNYNIYFASANASFILNNPKRVVLYNTLANIIYCSSTIPFNFNFSRINLFSNSILIDSNISKSTLPTYSWYKSSGKSLVSGTFNSTSSVISSDNFTDSEKSELPSLTNFIFSNKKIFSIGEFLLSVSSVTDTDTSISLYTLPLSSILIEYDNYEEVIFSDESGYAVYSFTNTLPIGANILFNVKEYNEVLYYTKKIQVVYSGELVLDSASSTVKFLLNPISLNPIICPRYEELSVTVIDSRVHSTEWKLYARLDHELESINGDTLIDSLVFIDDAKNINILSRDETLIYTGSSNDGSIKTTKVNFLENEGILLQIKDYLINNTLYEANIIWSIEE